jgi:integrase/recombinase XerD
MSPPGLLAALITLPANFKRHKDTPLFQEREAFLEQLGRNGMNFGNLRSTASTLRRVVQMLRLTTLREVSHEEIDRAAARWKKYPGRIGGSRPGPYSILHFARLARNWLKFHGKLLPRPSRFQPYSRELSGFAEYLRLERGYLNRTATAHSCSTGRFLRWFSRGHQRFSSVRLSDVDRYIKSRDWAQATVAGQAGALRAFFRYAGERKFCSPHISNGIDVPPVRWDPSAGQCPPWKLVRRIMAGTRGPGPAKIRARAIVLLCATYGLRSGEIASLRLRDLDWINDTVAVNRLKRRGVQQFPISRSLRHALVRYLHRTRPECDCESLFVTLHGPYRPMIPQSIYRIVRTRMDQVGVECRHRGPHALRHAFATRLLQIGTSLVDIADFLGHRDCQTVRVYAKHNLSALRSVATVDLCGTL